MRFSANLGFLFTEFGLPDAVRAAHRAGFAAVECHFPYATPLPALKAALDETGLPLLALNTAPGDIAAGDFGLAALPRRSAEARDAIDTAIAYAAACGAKHVHVMAGKSGGGTAAEDAFRANLDHSCTTAAASGLGVLIEPINTRDIPGYHLSTLEHGASVIAALGHANLRLMFDCYHVQIMQGDVTGRLARFLPLLGHVQIAAVPDRGAPDHGELDYRHVFDTLRNLGWTSPIGAEYRPGGPTENTLQWMRAARD
jgi:hydroxypyruvate isomerase